jgi:hypothetical protein
MIGIRTFDPTSILSSRKEFRLGTDTNSSLGHLVMATIGRGDRERLNCQLLRLFSE